MLATAHKGLDMLEPPVGGPSTITIEPPSQYLLPPHISILRVAVIKKSMDLRTEAWGTEAFFSETEVRVHPSSVLPASDSSVNQLSNHAGVDESEEEGEAGDDSTAQCGLGSQLASSNTPAPRRKKTGGRKSAAATAGAVTSETVGAKRTPLDLPHEMTRQYTCIPADLVKGDLTSHGQKAYEAAHQLLRLKFDCGADFMLYITDGKKGKFVATDGFLDSKPVPDVDLDLVPTSNIWRDQTIDFSGPVSTNSPSGMTGLIYHLCSIAAKGAGNLFGKGSKSKADQDGLKLENDRLRKELEEHRARAGLESSARQNFLAMQEELQEEMKCLKATIASLRTEVVALRGGLVDSTDPTTASQSPSLFPASASTELRSGPERLLHLDDRPTSVSQDLLLTEGDPGARSHVYHAETYLGPSPGPSSGASARSVNDLGPRDGQSPHRRPAERAAGGRDGAEYARQGGGLSGQGHQEGQYGPGTASHGRWGAYGGGQGDVYSNQGEVHGRQREVLCGQGRTIWRARERSVW
ncbi:hypothetical protein I350_08292 [Cryptococcus amylolentus CBS 6273]|uniref:Uncharacterized protein n=1 Tax=Cryptococcus amylolentus CBS 6273 TaxID=1296118 RepID=A0A1E3J5Y5_9TREE|nr:hypothetical protein I350_08292 [Cryptococcus amylolentus CBS 6273]